MSMQPAKWRETCDPFALNFTRFRLTEVLGYPHAGNDVFRVRGLLDGRGATAYLKVARQPGADIEREIALLAQLCEPIYPKVLDHGASPAPWSLTGGTAGTAPFRPAGRKRVACLSFLSGEIWRNAGSSAQPAPRSACAGGSLVLSSSNAGCTAKAGTFCNEILFYTAAPAGRHGFLPR